MRTVLASCISTVVLSVTAHANLITNFSFETPASAGSPSLVSGSTTLTGWTVINAEIAQIRNGDFAGLNAEDGTYSLDLTGYHDSSPYGGVQQTIATTPGATYSISFFVGAYNGVSTVGVTAGNLNTTASASAALASNTQVWNQAYLQFVASGSSTPISLFGTAASAGGTYIGLDNVSVNLISSAVPEPATFSLAGLALLAFARLCDRTRRSKKL